jgi:hypothetical protein
MKPRTKLMRTFAYRNIYTAAGIANVLRRTDVTGERREEQNEERLSRYSSENIIRTSKCPQENGCNRGQERGA